MEYSVFGVRMVPISSGATVDGVITTIMMFVVSPFVVFSD
jgi:hypothetical protein